MYTFFGAIRSRIEHESWKATPTDGTGGDL